MHIVRQVDGFSSSLMGADVCFLGAVVAAVLFLGEEFYLINGMGLAVLVMGVFWFNYTKYKKVAAGEIKPSKSANLEPWKQEDTPDVVSSRIDQVATDATQMEHCWQS